MTPTPMNPVLLSLFGSSLTFLAAYFWWAKNAATRKAELLAIEHQKTLDRVTETETQLRVITAMLVPLNMAMQTAIVKQMTHMHTPELDHLMTRIGPPSTLNAEEERRMFQLIDERTRDMGDLITEEERDAAKILPIVMKRAKQEVAHRQHLASPMRVVSMTATIEDAHGGRRAILLSSMQDLFSGPEPLTVKLDLLANKLDEHDLWEKTVVHKVVETIATSTEHAAESAVSAAQSAESIAESAESIASSANHLPKIPWRRSTDVKPR